MKPNTSKLVQALLRAGGVCGAVAAVGTVGIAVSTDAQAQVSATRHNLTVSGSQANRSTGTEICAFCHTPHASNTNATGAPLWNKAVPGAATFSVYTSTSLDSGGGTAGAPGAASLACLSCHDGSQGMDNMINQPGTGGWAPGGASAGYTWTGTGQLSSNVSNLGKDLRNDHPIGIHYAGGGYAPTMTITGSAGAKVTCSQCVDKDFWQPTRISNAVWYVDTDGTSGKGKTDMQLYPDAATSAVLVECGSCHDPHVITKASGQVQFLRTTQAGSALCLACHNK